MLCDPTFANGYPIARISTTEPLPIISSSFEYDVVSQIHYLMYGNELRLKRPYSYEIQLTRKAMLIAVGAHYQNSPACFRGNKTPRLAMPEA
jgi:hypothetical protein